jgi:serine/threonine protein kinase
MGVAFRPGTILLGKYRVESVLGRDGMCLVVKITHVPIGEELALKLLQPETATSLSVHARFLREAQSAARLRGEHVARIVEVGVMPDGVPYLVTEAVRGVDLAGELARRAPLGPGEAVDYALQVCEALAEAHEHGIVHRDIRPGNVILIPRPDRIPLVKVANFGISQTSAGVSTALARPDSMIGTPGYMAPEQMKATEELDGRTDLWALGVVLYECLSGVRPFQADGRGAATAPPRPLDFRIPGGLQATVLRCLEKHRDARFPSVAALAAALAPFAYDQQAAAVVLERVNLMPQIARSAVEPMPPPASPVALPPSAGRVASPSRSRRRTVTIAAVAVAASIGGISAAALIRPGRSRDALEPRPAPAQVAANGEVATAPSTATPSTATPSTATPSTATAKASSGNTATANPPVPGAPAANPATAKAGSGNPATTNPTVPGAPAANPATANPATANPAPGVSTPSASQVAQAVPASAAGAGTGEFARRQKLGRCAELEAQKAWRALDDCASELGKLGVADKAEQLHATARQELANQQQADRVQQALRDGSLKDAQAALRQIGSGSVYLAALRDAFARAEQQRADDARRKAQGLASAHDCAGLKRLVTLLGTTGTDRVVAAAQGVTCDDAPAVARAPDRPAVPASPPPATRTPAKPDEPASPPPATRTPAKPDEPASPPPAIAAASPPRKASCDSVNVDDVMTRAAIQYDSGAASSALSLTRVALGCKQTDRMYWLAVMYACAAHDLASAKLYFPRVPANLQSGIERKCQQDNLDVRAR